MPSNDRGVCSIKKHADYYLRDGNVCFLVEDTTFQLHKHFFDRESDHFRKRFQKGSEPDDGSVDKPYTIRDVKADEFEQLVWVWYNQQYSFAGQGKKKWLTILKLATMWGFRDVRALAICQLEELQFKPIEKILTYRHHAVEDDLLLPSYVSLCKSPTLPSPKEGEKLTIETVLKLASAREQIVVRAAKAGGQTLLAAEAPDDLVKEVVAKVFDLNLPSVTAKKPDPMTNEEEKTN